MMGPGTHLNEWSETAQSNVSTPSGGTSHHKYSDDDRPLLEELEIDLKHIRIRSITVLNPFLAVDGDVIQDTDLAGPFVVIFVLAASLTVMGRLHFGALYGLCTSGSFIVHALIHTMCEKKVPATFTVSVLGYCLIPVIIFTALGTCLRLLPFDVVGFTIGAPFIFWCAWCATKLFVVALANPHQKYIIMYPLLLLYCTFVYIILL